MVSSRSGSAIVLSCFGVAMPNSGAWPMAGQDVLEFRPVNIAERHMDIPRTGPKVRELQQRLDYLRKRLSAFEQVPAYRREAEHADEGEKTCRVLIAEIEARLRER